MNYKDILVVVFMLTFFMAIFDNLEVVYCTNPVTLKGAGDSMFWIFVLTLEVIISFIIVYLNKRGSPK